MTTCHLVARLQATFHGKVHLDHLQNARWQLVTLCELLTLFFKRQVKLMALLFERFLSLFKHDSMSLVRQADVKPLPAIEINEIFFGDRRALCKLTRTTIDRLLDQQLLDTIKRVVFHDAQLIVQILTITTQLIIDNRLRTLVAHNTFTCEHLNVDHRADHAGRHAQRSVFYIRGFLTENRTQQFFFRCELGLAFRCDLAHQHVVGAHFSADMHNTRLIQTVELRFSQVADVACDFLRAKLCVARNNGQFFNVNRSVTIVCHNFFGDQNRVFEVVAVPRHKCDQHVLAKRELAQICGRTVRQHITCHNDITTTNDWSLVDVGVLV